MASKVIHALYTDDDVLMHAVKNGKLDMVKALINAGADILTKNDASKTALDYAVRYKRKDIQVYLESL